MEQKQVMVAVGTQNRCKVQAVNETLDNYPAFSGRWDVVAFAHYKQNAPPHAPALLTPQAVP